MDFVDENPAVLVLGCGIFEEIKKKEKVLVM